MSALTAPLPNVSVDAEFQRLIPALLPEEFKQLEANILRDGCQEPLSVWRTGGENILLDGHNRYAICEKHGIKFGTVEVEIADRNYAKLWIGERQLGRRNLTDDQRAVVANDVREWKSDIAQAEQRKLAAQQPRKAESRPSGEAKSAPPLKDRTRKAVANEAKLPERKIRLAQEIKKVEPRLWEMARTSEVTLVEAQKIAVLPAPARKTAIEAVEAGKDVRSAIRAAKKEIYNATIAVAKPKALEGTYRIIYADPPWKYIGLNQADEYGHAERHYDCLTDEQLCSYKVGGKRLVKDMTDENAVLFLWVTSPMLERCFPIIKAWDFEYKASFVWDKVKHNMGHYNSVRHELLLVCTKGSCKPDVSALIDSVQSIERNDKHSQKPEEFYSIIEKLYDHGRRLELFARQSRDGWDSDGNEVQAETKVDTSAEESPMLADKRIRTPITYFGGKAMMTKQIIPRFPPHHSFVDVFGGSGAILLAKTPSKVEVFNDLDERVVNLYRIIRDPELHEKLNIALEQTPYSRDEFEASKQPTDDPVEAARRFVVQQCQSRMGMGESWSYTRMDTTSQAKKWHRRNELLSQVHERIRNVQIENRDWRDLLDRYDTPTTLFYCDPPYHLDTRTDGEKYRYEFTDADHRELVARLLTLKGSATVSGYRHESYQPLEAAGWNRVEFEVMANARNTRTLRTESLWTSPQAESPTQPEAVETEAAA